jgi:hypothetical protein
MPQYQLKKVRQAQAILKVDLQILQKLLILKKTRKALQFLDTKTVKQGLIKSFCLTLDIMLQQ